MTASRITSAWNRFWFAEQSPTPMAVYRIFYGVVLLCTLALLWPYIDEFYGPNGVLSIETARLYVQSPCLDCVTGFLEFERNTRVCFTAALISGVLLTLGVCTRFSALLVLISLLAIHHRNALILNSGDTLLRLGAYYLVFSNAGDALSLDRWWAKRNGQLEVPMKSQWLQKLLQYQVALVYFIAFTSKLAGDTWLDGTAVYYALHVDEFTRMPVPFITDNLLLSKLLTWGALATEASMFTLVWFRKFRYFVLAAAVLLHIGIDVTMNIPIFEWLMITSLVVFIYPEDLDRFLKKKALN